MKYLDVDGYHLGEIKRRLSCVGFRPDEELPWEIHLPEWTYGPYYVGYAFPENKDIKCAEFDCPKKWWQCEKHEKYCCVTIYPRAIYRISDPDNWTFYWDKERIPDIKTLMK